MKFVIVALAGGVGAVLRLWVDYWVGRLAFAAQVRRGRTILGAETWGVAVVNVLACGLLAVVVAPPFVGSSLAQAGAVCCTGFSTFSTAMLQVVRIGSAATSLAGQVVPLRRKLLVQGAVLVVPALLGFALYTCLSSVLRH